MNLRAEFSGRADEKFVHISTGHLYSGKARCTGMHVQIACNLKGDVAAIGPVPLHGARHDAYAFEASGLKAILENSLDPDNTGADLGYIGVDGIGIVPFKRQRGT